MNQAIIEAGKLGGWHVTYSGNRSMSGFKELKWAMSFAEAMGFSKDQITIFDAKGNQLTA